MAILQRSIPPTDFVMKVENRIGQAWFDGKNSFIDPRYTGGENRLPFWFPSYWRWMISMIQAQLDWKEADNWIMENAANQSLLLFT
jgi:hypothetical protein